MPLLIVSTHDRKVRTNTADNTITALLDTINAYIEDGYTPEELTIEGITD